MQKVAVGIIIVDGSLLLCQRRKGARYELQWEFPGGKVEENETIEACLRRELYEELSIEAGPITRTETEISHYDDGSSYEVHYCYLDSFTGTLQNNVFEDVQWVSAHELTGRTILQGNAGIVRRLLSGPFGRSDG